MARVISVSSCYFVDQSDLAPKINMFVRFVQISLVLSLTCHLSVRLSAVTLSGEPLQAEEQSHLMDEAEKNKYTVRRVEFAGNETIRHNILARRVLFDEGDIFTRQLLERSIRNLSKLKIIKPVRLSDVEVRLDRREKVIDFTINVRERPRTL